MITHQFYGKLARALNSGLSTSVILYGDTDDLFGLQWEEEPPSYIPLVPFLLEKFKKSENLIQLVVELNGPIRVMEPEGQDANLRCLREAWGRWRHVSLKGQANMVDIQKEFDETLTAATNQATVALEFLRQLCICFRWNRHNNKFAYRLLIMVEAAEMVVPAGTGDIAQLQPLDRRKVAILQDWFSDPQFYEGSDVVVLIAKARGLVHPWVTQMNQVYKIEVPSPDETQRRDYIAWQARTIASKNPIYEPPQPGVDYPPWNIDLIAAQTAGLNLQALRGLLKEACYSNPHSDVPASMIVAAVENFIQSEIGEDVVEFKKPTHTFADVRGFLNLKKFLLEELIPQMPTLAGFAVSGPIGAGKSFIFEALASELDQPIIVLKNLRSMWYGQTDVIFEKLRRVLKAVGRCLIFVDEADTQFGGVGPDANETEKRLTGKVQAMMSDTELLGQVVWCLMTARIEQLSADIRREGRAGDLIIPVLDPECGSEDYCDFVDWLCEACQDPLVEGQVLAVREAMAGRSAAAFASIRRKAKTKKVRGSTELIALIKNVLSADIGPTRRYQTLQAMLNCTWLPLLPKRSQSNIETERRAWKQEIEKLQAQGFGGKA